MLDGERFLVTMSYNLLKMHQSLSAFYTNYFVRHYHDGTHTHAVVPGKLGLASFPSFHLHAPCLTPSYHVLLRQRKGKGKHRFV